MNIFAIPMTPIKAYSINHFLIVLGILLSSVVLALILVRYSCQVHTVLAISGCILVIMEIFKQLLLTYVRGGSYSWSDFPFQLCSTPMYLCFIYLFVPKLRPVISDFIMVYGFIGSIASFIIPYSSFYSYLLLTMQSLIWHGILLFLSIYLHMHRGKRPLGTSYRNVLILYLALSVIAVAINALTYNISGGMTNMFFFGPGFPDVGILNKIKDMYGWLPETVIMCIASLFAGFVVLLCQEGRYHPH